MSLAEKAKTIRQRLAQGCCENWNSGSPCDKECDEPLIEVSVAQQEIDNLKDDLAEAELHCASYSRERGLQKQKLSIIIEMAKRYLKEGMDFAGYDRIAEELEELFRK